MNRKILLCAIASIATVIYASDSTAYAAGALAWEDPLQNLADNIQHSVVPSILSVMIAVSGMMVLFGEQNRFKPFFNIVLGTAMASQIVFGLTALGFDNILNPSISSGGTVAISHITITNDLGEFDLLSGFMNNFIQIVKNGANVLAGYALKLAGLLVIIDMSLSLVLGLVNEDKVKYLFVQVLKVGFFVFLIQNWVNGTFGISHAIVASFEKIGFLASGAATTYLPDNIVQNGITTFAAMWKTIKSLGIGSLGALLANLLIAFGVIGTTFITAIEMFMVRIEFWTIALITIPLLPFGLNKHTSFLAEKAIGAIFSLGIKVSVIAFLSAVACPLLASFAEQIKKQAESGTGALELSSMLQMLLACMVLSVLVHKIPNLAQGLISGSPSLLSGDLFEHGPNPISSAGSGLAAAGAAYGTYQMATNMEGGGTAMKSDGSLQGYSDSWLGRAQSFGAQSFGTARNMAGIGLQKINPFTMANMQTQTDIQMMRGNMASNADIAATAKGQNDRQVPVFDKAGNPVLNSDGTPQMRDDTSVLYQAQKTDGAVKSNGERITNEQGAPMTHGWTPPQRSDARMDQTMSDKLNALYMQHRHGK